MAWLGSISPNHIHFVVPGLRAAQERGFARVRNDEVRRAGLDPSFRAVTAG